MAQDVGGIYYTVDAQVEPLLKAEEKAYKSIDRLEKKMGEGEKAADQLGGGMNRLASAIKIAAAAAAIKAVATMVQDYREMSERIRMATDSTEEYDMVQRRLMETANGTYRALSEAQELYIRTADSLRSLGYNTEQAMDVQDSLSYAFVRNATSADRANAAISAVTKSFNTGKVAADQWETIMAAVPTVVDAIAASAGKTSAEIRLLGATGKLTAQQLSEGLRKSLDDNATAAANMAVKLSDAGVRMKTAITAVFVAIESGTGAIQGLTDGITLAANAILEFSQDADSMSAFLQAAELAAMSLASVIAARLIMSLYGSATAYAASVAATLAQTRANTGMTTSAIIAAGAVAKLRAVLAFLGGPLGVAMIAASAIYSLSTSAKESAPSIDLLTQSVTDLGDANLRLSRIQIKEKLQELESAGSKAMAAGASVEYLKKQLEQFPNSSKADEWRKRLAEQEAATESAGDEIGRYRAKLKELDAEIDRRAKGGKKSEPELTPQRTVADKKAEDAIAKRIADLELEADVLGMTATEIELYKLQLAGATDEQIRAAATSLAMVEKYERQEEAIKAAADAHAEAIKAFGKTPEDATSYITGNPTPLSGGKFDDQTARYQAEKDAEIKRHEEAMERLRAAQEAKIEVVGGYQALEEQMAQQHADRMKQINQAQMDTMLTGVGGAFGAMADNLSAYMEVFGSKSKEMFAIMKASAIASTIVSTYQGAQQAFTAMTAIGGPAGVALGTAAAAAAVVGGMARVQQIRSQSMPGRQYGGPVAAGQMYRVNENGAPEVFNAANGQQYMIPNKRGEVVSNADASGGGGNTIVLQLSTGVQASVQAEFQAMMPMIMSNIQRAMGRT